MRVSSRSRKDSRASALDLGTLAALLVMLLLLEVVPAASMGRLSVRTTETEMTGVDPGELYEIPPELPDDDQIDVQEIIDNQIPDVVEPVQIISTSDDTTGLSTAITVDTNISTDPDDPDQDYIPDPGTFVPHSTPPQCTFRPMPEYPEMARMAGVEGTVILQVFVDATGEVRDVVLVQGSGLDTMDEAAESAVWQTMWAAARRDDGQPVGVWTSIVYQFTLED